jgi:RNA polymerase sigma factor (sigma-70 family)
LPLESISIDEATMVKNCVANNAAAQKELYLRYADAMYNICLRYAKNSFDAKDMLQEGFIRVFKGINQYNGSGALAGWVRRVIVTTCLNYLKKYNNTNSRSTLKIDDENVHFEVATDNDFETFLTNKEIMQCFMQLPFEYRTILCLFAIDEYSHKEIAEMLSIEESTSRTKVFRARAMLKKILITQQIFEVKDI